MTKEQKFYKALQDVFIGAKIEGEGGFINLMKIKSGYYSQIEKLLKQDIDKAIEKYPAFREELFDKLHSFFSRYFTESGSIYFNSTPFHNNVYEKVYTDEKDVILFWKTQMLYYVKTDRLFRSMPIEFDGLKFYFDADLIENKKNGKKDSLKIYFDASQVENKKANEKRSVIFEIKQIREDETIVFAVKYSERGIKTKTNEILNALKNKNIRMTEELLGRAFRIFEKQSEVDYFVNKNAKAFLQEQFKLWSYQYFWDGAKEWSGDRVNQLQIMKSIAFKAIDFISQFEDELAKIWNKPKFVKNANYVITLDKITDKKIAEKIKKHKNYPQQIKEWKELEIDRNSPKAPIDTKFFKDVEPDILGLFDDLDNSLDGWLIKSENYQALNTILPKFREQVECVHIDPPYNTEQNGSAETSGFLYENKFRHSSWLAMMFDRISISRNLLNKEGNYLCHIDENEHENLHILMGSFFGYVGTAIWDKLNPMMGAKELAIQHEYILFCAENSHPFYNKPLNVERILSFAASMIQKHGGVTEQARKDFRNWVRKEKELSGGERAYQYLEDDGRVYRLVAMTWPNPNTPPPQFFEPLIHPITKKPCPVPSRGWSSSPENMKKLIKEGEIVFGSDESTQPQRKVYLTGQKALSSIIRNGSRGKKDLENLGLDFPYSHPVSLYETLIDAGCNNKEEGAPSLVLDYFAGSGTTAHAVINLNRRDGGKRKYILVEMGRHFEAVLLPRIKKVIFSENWKDGKAQDENGISHFIKYYELEQYEDALANCKYGDSDLFSKKSEKPYQDYVFMKDAKMLAALEIDYKKNKVKVDLSKLYPDIDIAETLSNLTGKWIKAIKGSEVEFSDGSKVDTSNLDYKLIKPLIWW